MRAAKRGRTYKSKKPGAKRRRVTTADRAIVTQSRVFIPRTVGNPMAYSETKYYDHQNTGTTVQAINGVGWDNTEQDPAAPACLFAPVQGNDFNNREGRKVWIKALKLRGVLGWNTFTNQTVAPAGNQIRIIVYIDRQTNGVQAQGEDVIESATKASEPCIHEFQNPKNFGRFRVIFDKTYTRPMTNLSYDGTNVEVAGVNQPFKFFKRFKKPLLVHFNATNGGTVADITDISLHIIAGQFTSSGTATLWYKSRVSFCE